MGERSFQLEFAPFRALSYCDVVTRTCAAAIVVMTAAMSQSLRAIDRGGGESDPKCIVERQLYRNPTVLSTRRPRATPTYSSWLNQIEIWFSKVERDVIARGIFTSVQDLARKLRRYINAYSANAKPIQWTYSDPTRRIRSNAVSATCR